MKAAWTKPASFGWVKPSPDREYRRTTAARQRRPSRRRHARRPAPNTAGGGRPASQTELSPARARVSASCHGGKQAILWQRGRTHGTSPSPTRRSRMKTRKTTMRRGPSCRSWTSRFVLRIPGFPDSTATIAALFQGQDSGEVEDLVNSSDVRRLLDSGVGQHAIRRATAISLRPSVVVVPPRANSERIEPSGSNPHGECSGPYANV